MSNEKAMDLDQSVEDEIQVDHKSQDQGFALQYII